MKQLATRNEEFAPSRPMIFRLLLGCTLGTWAISANSAPLQKGTATLSTAEIARRNVPNVVTITTPGGTGSGVLVDPSGIVVTSLHVLKGETSASVKLSNGDAYDEVSVVGVDERKDIVLVRIRAYALAAARLGDSNNVGIGDKVTLIGSPRGLDATVSDGVISAVRDSGNGYRLFQTSAPASPGSSGGGMFNSQGELIGIVASKLTDGENLNFAVPVNYVRGLMSSDTRIDLKDFAARYPAERSNSQGESSPATPLATTPSDATARIEELLKASGLSFSKTDKAIWQIVYGGNALEKVNVFVRAYNELLVASSIAARGPVLSESQLRGLMSLNFSADLAKLALDSDGDLTALAEVELRLLDGEGLKKVVDEVASTADDAAALLKDQTPAEVGRALKVPAVGPLTTLALFPGRSSLRYKGADWKPSTSSDPEKKSFAHRNGIVWTMVIFERVEIPAEKTMEIGMENARSVDAKAKVTRRGTRKVNGLEMRYQEWDATVEGVVFTYYAHYYSDSSGTYQLLGWTTRNLIEEARAPIEEFVSGFEIRRP